MLMASHTMGVRQTRQHRDASVDQRNGASMDADRLDHITRLASGASRRHLVAGLVGGVLSAALGLAATDAGKKRKKGKKGNKGKQGKNKKT